MTSSNGKQEALWAPVEGRLLAMLDGVETLTLGLLNEATCAWMEGEYNRTVHAETRRKPVDRYVDGTVSLEGIRFEIPNRFRHLGTLTVRYARWNLGSVHLVDPRTDTVLAPIYPIDKARNADGQRRVLEPDVLAAAPPGTPTGEMAPLLRKLMTEYAATGISPGYLPKPENEEQV
ncbi:MAG: hypothetical protein ACYSUI_06635 [Planctomycetota bacterium]|jgi:hypothetical protein